MADLSLNQTCMQGSTVLQKRTDTFQWCTIQAPNPCSFPVPADTSFLMESSKKVRKKQKWRLLKFKISRCFHSYRTNHQNPLPSLPLLKHLKKTHLPAQLIQYLSEDETLTKSDWLPTQPIPQLWFCFMIEEICLPPTCLYQVLGGLHQSSLTRERLPYLGNQPLKPQSILPHFYLHTVLTAYTTHP